MYFFIIFTSVFPSVPRYFSSHFSQQLLMAEIWYLVTSFIWYPISWEAFLLPVCWLSWLLYTLNIQCTFSGADPGFQVRGGGGGGAHLQKLCRAEGGANIFWGYFVWKITILPQKNLIFPILGGAREIFGVFLVRPPPPPPQEYAPASICRGIISEH